MRPRHDPSAETAVLPAVARDTMTTTSLKRVECTATLPRAIRREEASDRATTMTTIATIEGATTTDEASMITVLQDAATAMASAAGRHWRHPLLLIVAVARADTASEVLIKPTSATLLSKQTFNNTLVTPPLSLLYLLLFGCHTSATHSRASS